MYERNQCKSPSSDSSAPTWWIWADQQRTPALAGDSEARISVSGKEATRKACGVLVARLQGHSWAPPLPTGCVVNVGTIRCRPLLRPARPGAGRPVARLLAAGWDGALVVVRGRGKPGHMAKEGSRSAGRELGMPGGRR